MLKTIFIAFAVALGALLAYAATRPDSFTIERSARVQAAPERVFALINDLKAFNGWNPYEKKDPALKGTYGGPQAGVGARYGWESKEVGVGSLEIVEAAAPAKVAMKLDFVEPFKAHNRAEFTIRPTADGASEVTWAMHGPQNYMSKLMGVVFNMDKMVGKDFEQGLANLKSQAESSAG